MTNHNKASEAQASYIESLIKKRNMSKEEIAMWWVAEVRPQYARLSGAKTLRKNLRELSKVEASKGIEALLNLELDFIPCDNKDDKICIAAKELASSVNQ